MALLLASSCAWPVLEAAPGSAENAEYRQRVLGAGGLLDHKAVVGLGETHRWQHGGDPNVLMTYVRALVETGTRTPEELRADKRLATFAESFAHLLKGQIRAAEFGFRALANSEGGAAWGYLGLLELSLTARDFPAMAKWLEVWKGLRNTPQAFRWVLPHYSAAYLRNLGRYEELGKLLTQSEAVQSLQEKVSASLKSELLLRQNRFAEAHAVLDGAIASTGVDATVILAKAAVISAEKGLVAASQYLKVSQERLSNAWELEFHRVFHDVEASAMTQTEAAQKLRVIANTRRWDAEAIISIASIQLDLGDQHGALALVNDLAVEINDLIRFASYNLFMAKLDLHHGARESLANNLRVVRRMDSANPELLWLEYWVARKDRDHPHALQAIGKLLDLDPNDKPALQAASRVYEEMQRWDEVLRVGDLFLRSKRAISVKAEDEVRARTERAKASRSKTKR